MRPHFLLPLLAAGCWPYIPPDGPAGSGAGAIGEIAWNEYLGDYWDGGAPPGAGRAIIGFFEAPADYHWWTVFGPSAEDTCVKNYELPPYPFIDVGVDNVTLAGPTAGTTLAWNADLEVFYGSLGAATWAANASYGVSPFTSTVYGDIRLDKAGTSAGPFVLTTPALDVADLPTLGVNDLNFSWSTVTADRLVFEIELTDGANTLESVACSAANDGSFSVPPESWTSWRADRYVYVTAHAFVEDGGDVSFNRGESRVAGRYTLIGAALTR